MSSHAQNVILQGEGINPSNLTMDYGHYDLNYGFKFTYYYDHQDTKSAAATIKKLLAENHIRLATRIDPWY